ncbi:MAG: recombinase family protein [Planctomycetes bacterium]|nr:recombinase family protein [Planctomycetota bacterium]
MPVKASGLRGVLYGRVLTGEQTARNQTRELRAYAQRRGWQVAFLYDDALGALLLEGEGRVLRASHVEPTPDGRWQADLALVGGPKLPATPKRQDSIRAEIRWLEGYRLVEVQ